MIQYPDPPNAVDDFASTTEPDPVDINVLANDVDEGMIFAVVFDESRLR